jgi:hypothetical protein
MGRSDEPERRDGTDEAIHELLEYLTHSFVVEGELNAVAPAMRHVILALLIAEESAGTLTPYRAYLLAEMRGAAASTRSTKRDA